MRTKRTKWFYLMVVLSFVLGLITSRCIASESGTPQLPDFRVEPFAPFLQGDTKTVLHPEWGEMPVVIFMHNTEMEFVAVFLRKKGDPHYAEHVYYVKKGETQAIVGFFFKDGAFVYDKAIKKEIGRSLPAE
jgi:hypothetical protein